MLMKKEFSTVAGRRATVAAEPLARRQRQQSSNHVRAKHIGGTGGHTETETHWMSRHDNAGRQPFPGPLTMVRLRNNDVPGDTPLPALGGIRQRRENL